MIKTSNLNIVSKTTLSTPQEIFDEFPLTDEVTELIAKGRSDVADILSGKSDRKIMIVGPCSIHCEKEAVQYAERLKALSDEVSDKMLLVMRVYFEKPRTIVGWKGLIYDPDLNGSYNFEKGLRLARKLLLEITELGLPVATEILDPIITQYIADILSWGAIGARTTESQTHRQLVSGLSMPVGFKNATTGNVQVAIDAVRSAASEHSFIGVLKDGRSGIFRTSGNPYCHLVLRGGESGPNFGSEYIAFTKEVMKKAGLRPNIIVDCSHANSGKKAVNQIGVMQDIVKQMQDGCEAVAGVMLESNLFTGNQKVVEGCPLKPGISITDECLGWDETEKLLREVYAAL